MGRISPEIRATIIQLHKNGHKPGAIVNMLPEKVDRSSIYRLIFKFNITGSTNDIKHRKQSKITAAISDFIDDFTRQNRQVTTFFFAR